MECAPCVALGLPALLPHKLLPACRRSVRAKQRHGQAVPCTAKQRHGQAELTAGQCHGGAVSWLSSPWPSSSLPPLSGYRGPI